MALIDLVRELCSLNDDNLAERAIKNIDVQWCLSELLDILEQEEKLNEPLTLEELRKMDGEPVWWDNGDWGCWGIVTVDTDGFWAGIPFLRGRGNQINFEYNIKLNRMKIYRRPPEGGEDTNT